MPSRLCAMYERASAPGRGSTTDGSTAASRAARDTVARSPLILRILGVAASAVLGVGTFGSLGLALAQLFDNRGLIGEAGPDRLDSLAHLLVGVVLGSVIG